MVAPFANWVLDLQNKLKYMKHIGGPKNLPIIGCMLEIPTQPEMVLNYLIAEMNKVLDKGESVMKLWVGPKLIVLPLDAEAVKVLTSSNTELTKGSDYDFFVQWLGRGLLLGAGDHWFKVRRMATPAFHFAKLDEYCETMDNHASTMVKLIGEQTDGKREIDLAPFIKHCALDTIGETAMGICLNAQLDCDQDYVKAVSKFNALAIIYWRNPFLGMFGGLLWKTLGYKAQIDEALNVLKSMTDKVVRERMEVFKDLQQNGVEKIEKKRLNFLDLMLEYNSENQITMEQLREECDTFMFAGHDTTAHAFNEFGKSGADFRSNKLKELKYLDMVLKESMRLFAPVPFIQRTLQTDQIIGGHLIPKNTSVSISPFMLHRNPNVFTDPEKFDPNRFDDGKEYPATAYIPFSAGARNCIGQKFAVREAKIMIAHLVYNFQLTTHYKVHENLPSALTVTCPHLDLPVKVVSRND
ncbi:hypothetical protein M3Y97_00724600 [Aphelenchoides bicaudatus]|nr:hypothetical protein M3Y97_00724600 [Aphelenchoides bicaudatus]